MRNRKMTYAMITAVAGITIAGTALATPGSGVVSATEFARADFLDPVDLKFRIDHKGECQRKGKRKCQEVLKVNNADQTVVQQIVLSPGGQTGWHSHPGPVFVLVKTGALTIYSGDDPACGSRTYTAGQSFIDSGQGHVHIGWNESASEDLELWAVYIDVPPGEAFRIDAPAPGNCPF
jgi:quercetin dioxygenase-like cupin family protein